MTDTGQSIVSGIVDGDEAPLSVVVTVMQGDLKLTECVIAPKIVLNESDVPRAVAGLIVELMADDLERRRQEWTEGCK